MEANATVIMNSVSIKKRTLKLWSKSIKFFVDESFFINFKVQYETFGGEIS